MMLPEFSSKLGPMLHFPSFLLMSPFTILLWRPKLLSQISNMMHRKTAQQCYLRYCNATLDWKVNRIFHKWVFGNDSADHSINLICQSAKEFSICKESNVIRYWLLNFFQYSNDIQKRFLKHASWIIELTHFILLASGKLLAFIKTHNFHYDKVHVKMARLHELNKGKFFSAKHRTILYVDFFDHIWHWRINRYV